MANIKQAILAVGTALKSTNLFQVVRIWCNHLEHIRNGAYVGTPFPAAFIEVLNDQVYETLGGGFRSSDLVFRIHILHEFYNSESDFEQNLAVFDLRDAVLQALHLLKVPGCGPLTCTGEIQDYDHDNLYDYVLDFSTNFTDDTATPGAKGEQTEVTLTDPTLIITPDVVANIAGVPKVNLRDFIIPNCK